MTEREETTSVAVVGAGLSGLACARALQAAGLGVTVLDRGRAPGGRLASRTLHGRPVDLGASYLTASEPEFREVVDDWVARGLASPWVDRFHVATPRSGLGEVKAGPVRYGARGGLRSLATDLADGLPVVQEREVTAVRRGEDGRPTVDGTPYDAVVLALPDPQAAHLLDRSLPDERAAVSDRVWEPVLALAAAFGRRSWPEAFDGCFVHDSDVLGWIADDGRRRGDGAPVLVAHSTSPYAEHRLVDPAAAVGDLVGELRRVLQLRDEPESTFVQRWTFARPAAAREERFFLGDARVGLCGDGWGRPRVETAWLSGHRLGLELAARL